MLCLFLCSTVLVRCKISESITKYYPEVNPSRILLQRSSFTNSTSRSPRIRSVILHESLVAPCWIFEHHQRYHDNPIHRRHSSGIGREKSHHRQDRSTSRKRNRLSFTLPDLPPVIKLRALKTARSCGVVVRPIFHKWMVGWLFGLR